MQKISIAGILVLAIVFSLSSCDNATMVLDDSSRNLPPHLQWVRTDVTYLTVTYHSEGHTSGEVPIDKNRYEVPIMDLRTFTAYSHDYFVILDHGNLEKEGYAFSGWIIYQESGVHLEIEEWQWQRMTFIVSGGNFYSEPFQPGTKLLIGTNLRLEAFWHVLRSR